MMQEAQAMNSFKPTARTFWRTPRLASALLLLPVICGINVAPARAEINVATGNLYKEVTDYTTVGTNPLALIRSYNSQSYTLNLNPTLIGPNWRTNYDRYLIVPTS